MTGKDDAPLAIEAASAPLRKRHSLYPPVFATHVEGRSRRPLGDLFGLRNFGVNHTVLQPGAISALHHRHTLQDEFVYVLEGELTLHLGDRSLKLTAGMCAGFPAGGEAHHLENHGTAPAVYLEIGDRTPGDHVTYPGDDLVAIGKDGTWVFTHKDGTPW